MSKFNGRVMSSFSTKGGVGKTSFSKYFAIVEANRGKRVLIIDMCQNGDVASRLGYERDSFDHYTQNWVTGECDFGDVVQYDEETNLFFVPANHQVEEILKFSEKKLMNKEFLLKNKIDEIKDKFDLVIIDNHPTETNLMMVLSLVASDIVVIPTVVDNSSVEAALRSSEIVDELNGMGLNIQYFIQPTAVHFSRGGSKPLNEVVKYLNQKGISDILPPIRYSSVVQTTTIEGEELSKKENVYAKKVMKDFENVSKDLNSRGVL